MNDPLFQAWSDAPEDRQAFERWYTTAFPALFRQVLALANGKRELAEELLQDSMVVLVERGQLSCLPDSGSAVAYVLVTARRRLIDRLRRSRHEQGSASNIEQASIDADSPLELLSAEQWLAQLDEHLDTSEQRLLGRVALGWTLGEIAAGEGISYTAAGARVHRLRVKARAIGEK